MEERIEDIILFFFFTVSARIRCTESIRHTIRDLQIYELELICNLSVAQICALGYTPGNALTNIEVNSLSIPQ